MLTRRTLPLLILLCVSLVGCDHATKLWAHTELRAAPPLDILPGLVDLAYVQNHDVAFSLLRAIPDAVRQPAILALGLLGMSLLGAVWVHRRAQARAAEHLSYVLLMGGAAGNVLDRVFRGYVVDFIHVHHWPVFNVADVCIVAGALLLLLARRNEGTQAVATG